jgi:hypothetical protein
VTAADITGYIIAAVLVVGLAWFAWYMLKDPAPPARELPRRRVK